MMKTTFIELSRADDGYGSRCYYDNLMNCHYESTTCFSGTVPSGYSRDIKPTDMSLVFGKLMGLLEEGNHKDFQKVASGPCLYKFLQKFTTGGEALDRDLYIPMVTKEQWTYRPRLEAMFLENPENFKVLLNGLIEKNNSELFDGFYGSLKDTIFDRQFVVEWKTEQHGEQLKKKIQEMREVNQKEPEVNPEKKGKISALLAQLEEKINSFETVKSDTPKQAELRCFLFRNELLSIARSEEELLKEDEPYFAFMQSVYALLFEAIQFISCGRLSFFAKEYVDSGIKDIQEALLPKNDI